MHGGVVGFDRAVWEAVAQSESSVTWSRLSADGEMGFPGNVRINVTHTITEANEWAIEYSASTDKETVISMTNHAYFNLDAFVNNTQTVMDHILQIYDSDYIQDATGAPDYHLIATGKLDKIKPGSPWDFRDPKKIGKDINQGTVSAKGGYDNAWMFADAKPGMNVRPVLHVSSGITGITLEMHTDQPSVQIYSGNFLLGNIPRKSSQTFGKEKQYYQYRGAFTLEAQQYIDAVNNPQFPSVSLAPGQRYRQHTRYAFSLMSEESLVV